MTVNLRPHLGSPSLCYYGFSAPSYFSVLLCYRMRGIPWTIKSLCIPSPQLMLTPWRFMTNLTSTFHNAIQQPTQDRQFQWDHPFRFVCPFCSDCPFRTLASNQHWTAHHSHPTLANHQDQSLPAMSWFRTKTCEQYNSRKYSFSDCWHAHSCWTPGCHALAHSIWVQAS